jgi:ABC-type dipeptide/oligopeptide/nickel transport system permease subunit
MAVDVRQREGADAAAVSRPAASSQVRARGYWGLVWLRLRRDRVAMAGAVVIVVLFVGAFAGAPLARHVLGHGPNDIFVGTQAVNRDLLPAGPWTRIDTFDLETGTREQQLLVLGAADTLGRDELLRLLYGAQVSLEVAVFSTIGVMIFGVLLGALAGFYRGPLDAFISTLTQMTMAFPLTLFIIALAATVGPRLDRITLGGVFAPGVFTLTLVFTLFGWFYPARIMRAQVLSQREKEYVEAARMIGASETRILRSHVLPHLLGPIIVYSTLLVAGFVILEASLSFLGIGIKAPTASWGNLLSNASAFYTTQPWLMVWPGLAVLITTLAFNLLGDGLRDAIDPRGTPTR